MDNPTPKDFLLACTQDLNQAKEWIGLMPVKVGERGLVEALKFGHEKEMLEMLLRWIEPHLANPRLYMVQEVCDNILLETVKWGDVSTIQALVNPKGPFKGDLSVSDSLSLTHILIADSKSLWHKIDKACHVELVKAFNNHPSHLIGLAHRHEKPSVLVWMGEHLNNKGLEELKNNARNLEVMWEYLSTKQQESVVKNASNQQLFKWRQHAPTWYACYEKTVLQAHVSAGLLSTFKKM